MNGNLGNALGTRIFSPPTETHDVREVVIFLFSTSQPCSQLYIFVAATSRTAAARVSFGDTK